MSDEHRYEKLAGVHPALGLNVRKVFAAMEALGFHMIVTDGLRTTQQQKALYAKGRTLPGPIVTHADGDVKKSKHQEGRAVDCCFLINGQPSWADTLPWALYGQMANVLGCNWGGDWETFKDKPHIELP